MQFVRGDDHTNGVRWTLFVKGVRHAALTEHAGGFPVAEHSVRYYRVENCWPGVAAPSGRFASREEAADAAIRTNLQSGLLDSEDGLSQIQRRVLEVAAMFPAGEPGDGDLIPAIRRIVGETCSLVTYRAVLCGIARTPRLSEAAGRAGHGRTVARVQRRLAGAPHRRERVPAH